MGFDDEAEQSVPWPCHQINGRSKQTCELTSSIVPRGASFHRTAELEFPPIAFDFARFSCCYDFPGPAERGPVNPDAVITANRRARATIAFFKARRMAICIAQALSQDHFAERSMLGAAS
jgi:hypothetical protein